MSGWGQPGLFSHELQLGSLIADLLPRTGLAAAVGKPLRVSEFGTEQGAESRGEMGEGLRPGRLMVVCVKAYALLSLVQPPGQGTGSLESKAGILITAKVLGSA